MDWKEQSWVLNHSFISRYFMLVYDSAFPNAKQRSRKWNEQIMTLLTSRLSIVVHHRCIHRSLLLRFAGRIRIDLSCITLCPWWWRHTSKHPCASSAQGPDTPAAACIITNHYNQQRIVVNSYSVVCSAAMRTKVKYGEISWNDRSDSICLPARKHSTIWQRVRYLCLKCIVCVS